MGKASSAKKVARAARAGGTRRPGQRRALGFPAVIAAVVVLGVGLVVYARDSREANAAPRSAASDEPDHWHAAYGLAFCGDFVHHTPGDFLVDIRPDTTGIHTHADGVIHIHPFIDSAAGLDARMRLFFSQVGLEVTDSRVTFPSGETWVEGEDTCPVDGEDVPGQIVLAKWNDAQDAADGERPNDVFTEDFGNVRFQSDREYYTLAFVPEGQLENIPVRPDILTNLDNLTDVIEAPEAPESPGDTTFTEGGGVEGDPADPPADTGDTGDTGDTADDLTTSSTAPPAPAESTTTTAAG